MKRNRNSGLGGRDPLKIHKEKVLRIDAYRKGPRKKGATEKESDQSPADEGIKEGRIAGQDERNT